MKIGFIVGKINEIWDDPNLKKKTPKKYLVDTYNDDGKLLKNQLHIDVAIAMTVKLKFPEINVDIILPKEIEVNRLKKNNINYVLGYDYITTIEEDPYIRKFVGKEGQKRLLKIYSNPKCNIFPPIKHMDFIWDKKKYLTKFKNAGIPINPAIFIKGNVNVSKLLAQVSSYKWDNFIIKPIGGSAGFGVKVFKLKEVISSPTMLMSYFNINNEYYSEYIVQKLIKGFKKGEIKSFWIDGIYRYAISTIDIPPDNEYIYPSIIKPMTDKKILDVCKPLGEKVLKTIPKLTFNGKKTLPVATRIDFVCCLDNKPRSSNKYFVNEIEEGNIAGTYTNIEGINYPLVDIMADAFVRKAVELL